MVFLLRQLLKVKKNYDSTFLYIKEKDERGYILVFYRNLIKNNRLLLRNPLYWNLKIQPNFSMLVNFFVKRNILTFIKKSKQILKVLLI